MNDHAYLGEYRCGWISWGWSYAKVCVQRRVRFLWFWKRWSTCWHYKGSVMLYHDLSGAHPDTLMGYYTSAIREYEAWRAAWRKAKEVGTCAP